MIKTQQELVKETSDNCFVMPYSYSTIQSIVGGGFDKKLQVCVNIITKEVTFEVLNYGDDFKFNNLTEAVVKYHSILSVRDNITTA